MAFKNVNGLVQKLQAIDYNKVKDLLNKADVDFKDSPDWEDKVDFIREGLKDDIDIDEDIAQIYLKGKKLYGLKTYPEDEPEEVEIYKWN